ncbi:MAG: type III-A CRISPR-associated protein Csm2 [Magnetococcus sp. WYHC-3]
MAPNGDWEGLLKRVIFKPMAPDLLDDVAEKVAKSVAEDKGSNKPTQLRRFYDEICMWEERLDDKSFEEHLPYLRMLNSKAAYAEGRNNLVDEKFVGLMRHGLKQVTDMDSLKRFKLFMEAFMGFYKKARPRD